MISRCRYLTVALDQGLDDSSPALPGNDVFKKTRWNLGYLLQINHHDRRRFKRFLDLATGQLTCPGARITVMMCGSDYHTSSSSLLYIYGQANNQNHDQSQSQNQSQKLKDQDQEDQALMIPEFAACLLTDTISSFYCEPIIVRLALSLSLSFAIVYLFIESKY